MSGSDPGTRSANVVDLATMADVRSAIDAVDGELVQLLAKRFDAIRRASELKTAPEEAFVGWRVEQVVARVRARAVDVGFDPEAAERIWRCMIDECIAFERHSLARRTSEHPSGIATKRG